MEKKESKPTSEAQKRAVMKYNASNVTQIKFAFNKQTDKDILQKLASVDNKQGYVKDLIRKDINSTK